MSYTASQGTSQDEYDIGDGILVVQNLVKDFGGLRAVDGLSFAVKENEILGFIGPNGAGKSTTFNCITGYQKPTAGTIQYRSENITGYNPHEVVERGLARTFQTFKPLRDRTILENVQLSRTPNRILSISGSRSRTRRDAEEICKRIGLGDSIEKSPSELPHAGLLRLELARAVGTDPDLILVDEPFAGLSKFEVEDISELFLSLRDDGITLVLVDHNMRGLLSLVDRVIAINFGSMIADGTPEEVRNDVGVQEAYFGGDKYAKD